MVFRHFLFVSLSSKHPKLFHYRKHISKALVYQGLFVFLGQKQGMTFHYCRKTIAEVEGSMIMQKLSALLLAVQKFALCFGYRNVASDIIPYLEDRRVQEFGDITDKDGNPTDRRHLRD